MNARPEASLVGGGADAAGAAHPSRDPDNDGDPLLDWTTQVEVHQATKMVIAQVGVSVSEAFARLRAHAVTEGLLLRDVAHDVVARRLQFAEGGVRWAGTRNLREPVDAA